MAGTPLITVYTQGYNAEKYIGQCIESVLHQTCGSFEYYVCDHGSTDNTLQIIERYAKADSRIHIMHRDNAERGFYPEYIAKNGVGKYFAMIDSDDYIASDHFEKLLAFAELNDLDMAICSIYGFNDGEDEVYPMRMVPRELVYDIEENDKFFSEIYLFLRTVWGKLIRMDCLRRADFSAYRENAKTFISDDTAFTLANYAVCRRVGAITEPLLFYRQLDSSVTAKYKPTMIDNNGNIFFETLRVLDKIGDYSVDSRDYAVRVYLSSALDALDMMVRSTLNIDDAMHEIKRQRESRAFKMCVELVAAGSADDYGLIREWEDAAFEMTGIPVCIIGTGEEARRLLDIIYSVYNPAMIERFESGLSVRAFCDPLCANDAYERVMYDIPVISCDRVVECYDTGEVEAILLPELHYDGADSANNLHRQFVDAGIAAETIFAVKREALLADEYSMINPDEIFEPISALCGM